jgi:hypothetical protein
MDATGIEVMSTVTNKTGKYSFNRVNEEELPGGDKLY